MSNHNIFKTNEVTSLSFGSIAIKINVSPAENAKESVRWMLI